MSVINSQPLIGASGQGGGYNLERSLRFRSSASAYLNKTFSTPTAGTKGTSSFWVKRGSLGSAQYIWSGSNYEWVRFLADDTLQIANPGNVGYSTTTQVFRDPSAWYHIVVAWDTTLATASDRAKIWVNGSLITSYSSTATITQNSTFIIWNANGGTGSIGTFDYSRGSSNFDGYLAEHYWIDGQALTPSSFGETSATTGVWIPKKYTGTYGTNGFYLDFKDTSSTAALGYDAAGSNDWTVNNISLTSGSTYDSMKDVPTLTDENTANYCVWNPINNNNTNTITNGNLSGSNNGGTYATMPMSNGKYYWEYRWTSGTGIAMGVSPMNRNIYFSNVGSGAAAYFDDGQKTIDGTNSSYGSSYTTSDVIGVALDTSAGTITFYKNNVSQGAFSLPSGITEWVPSIWSRSGTVGFNANFGQQPFAYTTPTGFKPLNTYNLPTPTIGATASTLANKYMDVSLYTGNGGTLSVTNANSFQPDLVWLKGRSVAYNHGLFDAVRGTGKSLSSSTTGAEVTNDVDGYLSAFNSNGFTLVAGSTSSLTWNQNNATFVGWQWKANGTGSSNTAGTITSTVSANTSAGFSIVTYTGNGLTNQSVGHGLGATPGMVIIKQRDGAANWLVHHQSQQTGYTLYLNLTNAEDSGTSQWGTSPQTSSLFYVGFVTGATGSNVNGSAYVAYCFAEVAGYSKFGSYIGNGSTDGTFVYTGFRPKFVLIKRSDAGSNWYTLDSSRNTYNLANSMLCPNLSAAEFSTTENNQDFLSNGFKVRTSNVESNANGGTYIYMAFCESPFKYSVAR